MNQAVELAPWQKWVKRLAYVSLTLLTAWLLATIFWMVLAPEPITLKAPVAGKSASQAAPQVSTAQYHLFGEVGAEPVVAVQEVDAPDTRLRLELLGVMQSSVAEMSSAIIAQKGGKGDFHRVGDVVQGRTKLAGVYPDKVILDTAGKLETLKFEEFSNRGVGVSAQAPAPTDREVREERVTELRDRFSRIRRPSDFMGIASEAATESPEAVIEGLGLESVGVGEGYRVDNSSILLKAGMKPGDVLLSINGQQLGDASSDQALLDQVMQEGRAQIEVQRGNSRFMINQSFGARN
ncbi:MAG: type II secretion system protein N [Pseudomonadota bacterium]|nr:type II secretion system protein N [Pseudomonadota bacterium]